MKKEKKRIKYELNERVLSMYFENKKIFEAVLSKEQEFDLIGNNEAWVEDYDGNYQNFTIYYHIPLETIDFKNRQIKSGNPYIYATLDGGVEVFNEGALDVDNFKLLTPCEITTNTAEDVMIILKSSLE